MPRAFGLGDAHTYYDITKDVFGEDYFFKMEQIKDRFWFSHCYENIADIEKGIYKEKAVFMPLGLPDDFYTVENQWTGATDKVLFSVRELNLMLYLVRFIRSSRKTLRVLIISLQVISQCQ